MESDDALNIAQTHQTIWRDGQETIKCLVCNRVSYNPNDVKNKYCGSCHKFHPITDEPAS